MRLSRKTKATVSIVALIGAASSAAAEGYENAPQKIIELSAEAARKTAERLARGDDHETAFRPLQQDARKLFLFAVADGLGQQLYRRTETKAENLGETARTDKHIGAAASATGSTSVVEKAGIPRLLSFAIENGAIQQETRGTNLTLSTSPYAFLALAQGGDTSTNFERFWFWRKFGMAATFSAEDGDAATINDLDTENLSEVSLRIQLWGDRSTRDPEFRRLWAAEIQPDIQNYVNELSGAATIVANDPELERRFQQVFASSAAVAAGAEAQPGVVFARVAERAAGTVDAAQIEQILLTALKEEVVDPIKNGTLVPTAGTQTELETALPKVASAESIMLTIPERTARLVETYNEQVHLFSVSGTLHRIDQGTDYTEAKLHYQHFIDPIDVIANGGVSFNHEPDRGMDQHTVRAFSVSVGLEMSFDNILTRAFSTDNIDPITVRASGKFERVEDLEDEIGIVEVKFDVPLMPGFSIPLSLTYASRTETSSSDEFRVNFGGGFDVEKALAVVRSLGA